MYIVIRDKKVVLTTNDPNEVAKAVAKAPIGEICDRKWDVAVSLSQDELEQDFSIDPMGDLPLAITLRCQAGS